MDFALGGGGGKGGGRKGKGGKADVVAQARLQREARKKALEAQQRRDAEAASAATLHRAARRCGVVLRLRLRQELSGAWDADAATASAAPTGAPAGVGALSRRLLLFCDLGVAADAARFRRLALLVLKRMAESLAPAATDPRWWRHAARLGGLAARRLGTAGAVAAGGTSKDFGTEVRLLVALTDSAGWGAATEAGAAAMKAASKRVTSELVLSWGLYDELRCLLVGRGLLAAEPLWAQAVLTLAAKPVLALDGAGKIDAVRRLVRSLLCVPALLAVPPRGSTKPLRVVIPAVLHWLSVSPLHSVVPAESRTALAANCVDAALAGDRPANAATLQRVVTVVAGLLTEEQLATAQEASQLAAAWRPQTIRLLALQSISEGTGAAQQPDAQAEGPALPWTFDAEPPSSAALETVPNAGKLGIHRLCLVFSALYQTVASFPAVQNELISNMCAVPDPSMLGIVWDVLTAGGSEATLRSLVAAAATRTLATHPVIRPLQLFLRMSLFIYSVLQDDEIISKDSAAAFPLSLSQLRNALHFLNQVAFRVLWDGDALAFPAVDRDVCDRIVQLLRVLYSLDERMRVAATEVVPELWWRVGNSKLSKSFETEFIRRTGRAIAIAQRMPHLPKRSAAQRLTAANRRRMANVHQSDPRNRSESLRHQGIEAAARIDFHSALQCFTAALGIDHRNHLALANRSAVYCSLGDTVLALEDARMCIQLAKDSPAGYLRLANAMTDDGDLENAVENYDIAAALDPADTRLAALLVDAEKRLEASRKEASQSVKRMADSQIAAQKRAEAKKAAMLKNKIDEQQRRERERVAGESKKAAVESLKLQRREEHEARQKAEAEKRAEKRFIRDEEKALRAAEKAQADEERQRIEAAAEKKLLATQKIWQEAEMIEERRQAEQARITQESHRTWKKTLKERQIVDAEKMRVLATQRQERKKMEREHAAEIAERSRRVAAAVSSSRAQVPTDFICPLTETIMLSCVTAADGYNYEREAIQAWQLKNDTSPMTDERMTKWLTPNSPLQRRIEAWLAQQGGGGGRGSGGGSRMSSRRAQPAPSPAPQFEPEPEPESEPESDVPGSTIPDEEALDPISLEPLSELRYPPFDLPIDGEGGSHPELYDAQVLSNYLVASGNFAHPTSRRPLERGECVALDTFIRKHRLGRPCVATSFDHAQGDPKARSSASGGGEGGGQQSAVERHQEEASDLLIALFGGTQAAATTAVAAAEQLEVVDHANMVARQAGESVLAEDEFPSLQ